MDFFDAVKNELNNEKTVTTNGAVAYKTSGTKLLDFNFALSSMRNMSEDGIKELFTSVYYEDPVTAVKYMFYIGDVREGVGERKVFRACIDWLIENKPEEAIKVIGLIPHYTRWDNIIRLIDCGNDSVVDFVREIVSRQLFLDLQAADNNKPVSLLAKWMPSENASSKKTRELARKWIDALSKDAKKHRKMLSTLRKHIDVTETKMSAKEWDKIDYKKVPSKANLIYNNAFLRNDEQRRREYLRKLSNGEAKINAAVLQPHEIVNKYKSGLSQRTYYLRYKDETLEQLWKSLKNIQVENTLFIRDGSGSMECRIGNGKTTALDVSTALAIYTSEHNSGQWKDKYITFSANPKIVDLSNCKTLKDKLVLSYKEADCSNTDIYKTMKLILKTAIKNHMIQEDMPKTIMIVSDMQFDGRRFNFKESLFDGIKREFESNGYLMPRIVFWNVAAGKNDTVPMQKNELGLILCSGFSTNILKMMMSGEVDPYKVLLEQINSERYKPVEDMLALEI